ncbi:tyrosine-protein phosphatase [Pseudonocardia benzenivorans]
MTNADPFRTDLPTFTNFRDVGGLRTVDGRTLRSGVLFRSDSVQDITEAEAEVLVDKLGLRYLIDLRTGPEAVQQGRGPLANLPVGYLNIPSSTSTGPRAHPGGCCSTRTSTTSSTTRTCRSPSRPSPTRCVTRHWCTAPQARTALG